MTSRFSLSAVAFLAALLLAFPAFGQNLRMPKSTPPPPADTPAQTTPAPQTTPAATAPAAPTDNPAPPTTATDAQPPASDAKLPPSDTDQTTPAYPVAEILVRINGQIISKQDLDRAETQMNEQAKEENWSPDVIAQHKKQLLSDLIDQQLLLSRGKELNINPDDELIRRLDEIRKQNHLDSMEDLEKAAQQQGVSFDDFKANIRNSIITQQVVRDEVSRTIHLTSSEEMAYYEAHKDQFTLPESVKLAEVLVPAGDTDSELASAQARADKIHDELAKGADFAEMAKSVSTGPTAAQGGELGVFKRGQLAKELEDKTFGLKKGQITAPIRTKQGFVILKVEDYTPPGLQPFKDVEAQIQQQVYAERMQPALRVYLTKLRGDAFIDVKPGYADVNASPNASKPVFSAYTPPQKKSKKAKPNKERFRDRSVVASKRPPPVPRPKDADDTVTAAEKKAPAGGPTEVAAAAYDATQKQRAAASTSATPVNAAAAEPKARKYKVRYGHGEKAAQLPPAAADAGQQPAGTSVSPGDTSVEARLTPESQQILGNADDTPRNKTRFTARPHESHQQAKAQKTEAKTTAKKTNAPAPPDAAEVATQAVNSAPLGLNGNTAAKTKPAAPATKQRLEDKKAEVARAQSPNGAPGEVSSTTDSAKPPAPGEKKRHKLLGIL
jgi:peptidyl-prolyl cis-trans isomerase SurA